MKVTKEAAPGRFRYDWDEIVTAAKASPREWIKPDHEYPHSVYTALSRGKNSKFPLGEWEFQTSATRYDIEGKRWCALHIRYTPQEKEDQA